LNKSCGDPKLRWRPSLSRPARKSLTNLGEMKMSASSRQALTLQRGRRDFLVRSTSAVLAAGALGIPRASRAAEPVNIGALYPTTGSFAQIGQGCVNAAKLAVQMVNDAGGIKSQGGAKLNLIVSDVQSDTTVTRTETDRLISGNKLSAIHGCFASALTLIASEVAERAKVPLLTGSSSDQLNKGRHYTFTPFARASQFAQAQLQMASWSANSQKSPCCSRTPRSALPPPTGCASRPPARGRKLSCSSPTRPA
jgi:branched-chain amino acid transport system substrate-binding protein